MSVEDAILFYNAIIYSGSVLESWMIIDSLTGIVLKLGSDLPNFNEAKEHRNCQGKLIIPGLHDAHMHVSETGLLMHQLDLRNSNSIQEFQMRIKQYALNNPSKNWIVGYGWEQDKLGRYPTIFDLDEIILDRPVLLRRICEHVAIANSKALNISGINDLTPDPLFGSIDHLPADHPTYPNKLSGLLKEEAIGMVRRHINDREVVELKSAILDCLLMLLQNGVTSVCACERDTWHIFNQLALENALPIRIFYSAYFIKENPFDDSCFPPYAGIKVGQMLSCDRIKLFADGSLGSSTAAISCCYKYSNNKGDLLYTKEGLNKKVLSAHSRGFRIEVHVIGDAAAQFVLQSFEEADIPSDSRPVMIHCQILRDDLLPLMKERGVVASIQPQFLVTDCRWINSLLPDQLTSLSYAWKSLLNYGIHCAGGTDSPVEEAKPLLGIYDSIFRRHIRGKFDGQIFMPNECLSVNEAIDLFTKGGAYAAKMENILGELKPGYLADFIVLNINILKFPEQILNAKVEEVWVGGMRKL